MSKAKIRLTPMGERYFERAREIKDDFTVVEAEIKEVWGPYENNKGGMIISWSTVSAGFGELTICVTNDGKIQADTEGMDKDFCKEVFSKLVDSWQGD